jgi:hypothetical protein
MPSDAFPGGGPWCSWWSTSTAPGHKREPAWWTGELLKLEALAAAHPGGFFYATRGGYRLVYRLASPVMIRTVDDKEAWRERYRRELLYLARHFAIVGDPACSDITRLYRLPRVIREAGAPVEDHPTMGDPAALGVWTHEPSAEELERDVSTARTLASKEPNAWGPVLRALEVGRGRQDGEAPAPRTTPRRPGRGPLAQARRGLPRHHGQQQPQRCRQRWPRCAVGRRGGHGAGLQPGSVDGPGDAFAGLQPPMLAPLAPR